MADVPLFARESIAHHLKTWLLRIGRRDGDTFYAMLCYKRDDLKHFIAAAKPVISGG